MSDRFSELPRITGPITGLDLLYVSEKTGNTFASKMATANQFFANVQSSANFHKTVSHYANTTFTGANSTFTSNVNVRGGTLKANKILVQNSAIRFESKQTPSNSSIAILGGNMFFDSNYLYFATANNQLKRVALSSF